MSEAVNKIRELNNNEETRLKIDRMKRARLHENTEKLIARQEGLAEGEKAKAIAIAKNLKGMNMPVIDISNATGLTVEEIKKL